MPARRIFVISYGQELSSKHASDFRAVVEAKLWGNLAFLTLRPFATAHLRSQND